MTNGIDNKVADRLRALYRKNEVARRFFDYCAERERDASETSIDRIAYTMNVSRESAINLAQELQKAGIGSFVVGRRGHKSRFSWDYSRISVGQVAAGETSALEKPEDAIDEVNSTDAREDESTSGLTIAQAKRELAKTLGVSIDAIRITVDA